MKNLFLIIIIFCLIIIYYAFIKKNKKEIKNEKEEKMESKLKKEEIKELKIKEEINKEIKENPYDYEILPGAYLVDEIVLMPKNTSEIFVYWEINDNTYIKLKENENIYEENPTIILKSLDGNIVEKIKTYSRNSKMYIHSLKANEEYYAQIGYYNDKEFIVISTSKSIKMPSDKESDNLEIVWGIREKVKKEEKEIVEFKILNEEEKREYIGYKQELLDTELLKEENNNYYVGSSEKMISDEKNNNGSSLNSSIFYKNR